MKKSIEFFTTNEELSNTGQYPTAKAALEEGDESDTIYHVTVVEVGTIERTLVPTRTLVLKKKKGRK